MRLKRRSGLNRPVLAIPVVVVEPVPVHDPAIVVPVDDRHLAVAVRVSPYREPSRALSLDYS